LDIYISTPWIFNSAIEDSIMPRTKSLIKLFGTSLTSEDRDLVIRKKSITLQQTAAINKEKEEKLPIPTNSVQEEEGQRMSEKQYIENRQELLGTSTTHQPASPHPNQPLTIDQILAKYGHKSGYRSLTSQTSATSQVRLMLMTWNSVYVLFSIFDSSY
jgi:hypothetical protein